MKILYIDMDNVVVDFPTAFKKLDKTILNSYKNREDEVPGIFSLMNPMENAKSSVLFLAQYFEIYFLSTAPWENPSAWTDKLNWIKNYFPEVGYKRLILSHNKQLNAGDYLIDDRLANGADRFTGEHIMFGTEGVKNWKETVKYICEKENINSDPFFNDNKKNIEVPKNAEIKATILNQAKELQSQLFPEESDFYYDSYADANDRAYGRNPMSAEYMKEVEARRANYGVSPLGPNGLPTDNSSLEYCKSLILNKIIN